MGETVADSPPPPKSKPTITVPPRGSVGFLFTNGPPTAFSPGPMTLVSGFFPEQSPFSFSQLLAMASPKTPFLPAFDSGKGDFSAGLAAPQMESLSPIFMVAPSGLMNSPGYLSPLPSPFGMSHQQALAHVTAQAALSQSLKQMQAEYHHSSSTDFLELTPNTSSSPLQLEPLEKVPNPESETSKKESSEASQSDKKTANDKPASDGYNWRKYGQKNVKASECPRSYYKCTHLNCPVRKKVERSEITYKGEHNHDPPKPNKPDKDTPVSDKPAKLQLQPVSTQGEIELSNEAITVNSVSCNDSPQDNALAVVNDENTPVKPVAKKRNTGVTTLSQRGASDTKIVLQTRSEVDYLDDGYKWRKYGQKVVKGNAHPRSYYRCTYIGCNVRKHVERASADPKMVVTTYEGKHDHDLPVGRFSGSAQSLQLQKVVPENPSAVDE